MTQGVSQVASVLRDWRRPKSVLKNAPTVEHGSQSPSLKLSLIPERTTSTILALMVPLMGCSHIQLFSLMTCGPICATLRTRQMLSGCSMKKLNDVACAPQNSSAEDGFFRVTDASRLFFNFRKF